MFASTLPSEEELDGVKSKVCSRHTTRRCIIDVFASLLSGKAAIKREQSEIAHVLQSMPQGEKLHYGLVLCNVYKRGIQKVEFTIKK